MKPTAAQLRRHLTYDALTGIIRWREPTAARVRAGAVAGTITWSKGGVRRRRAINIFGRRYYASNIAWCIVTGRWPTRLVDHRDGNTLNDKWENLRRATHLQNLQNCGLSRKNTSGAKGVSFDGRRGKWVAQLVVNKKHHWLGRFATKAEAEAVHRDAETRLRGQFRREIHGSQAA